MKNYKTTNFVKRIKVKGYSRRDLKGNLHTVSPHYRIIKTLKSSESLDAKKRPKLI